MEEIQEQTLQPVEEDENDINLPNITKSANKFKIIDSDDSESESKASEENASKSSASEDDEKVGSNSDNEVTRKKKRKMVIKYDSDDSDAKPDDEVTPHNKSFPDEETAVETVIYTANSKGEFVPETTASVENVQKSLSSLYDPDSSEEEPESAKNDIEEDIINETIQPKVYKPPRRRKKGEEEPKKMTAQEAAKQKVEIQSESQRMVRECNVSLPYHKPKSYTIKEFLQKRSKLASALPLIPKAPASVAIKMPKEKLEEVSKKINERIKQVEEFYKSESEDEEEEQSTFMMGEIRSWLNVLVENAMDKVDVQEAEDMVVDQAENETKEDANNQREPFSMDYEFSLDDVDEEKSSKRPKVRELLQEKILNVQPKLSGGPDDIIDLETGVARPSEVKKFVEKFLQHTARKVPHKHKVELDVIGVSGKGEIIKETVSMNVDEEEPVIVETPGAKLQRLREELQKQMAQRRSELWKQKQEQGDCLSSEKKLDEKSEEGAEKDILDDEEEEEFEMTDSENEDEEEEEDYVQKPEKPKVKSAFVEDEAEEDEIEDDEELMEDNEENDENGDDNNGSEGDGEEETENIVEDTKKKTLKRIIKPFSEDSDEEEEPTPHIPFIKNNVKDSFDSTISGDDEILPPNLPRVENTPQRPSNENKKTELDFLTPVTYLTGLQNLNSDSKFSKDSPIISPFRMPLGPSPSKKSQDSSGLQKVLFPEQTQNSQENMDELAKICSGGFPETQNPATQTEKVLEDEVLSTQELLNLCTGGFSDATSASRGEDCDKIVLQSNPETEIKSLDDDHGQIISQLLDEDEMERFKKKFESPVVTGSQKTGSFDETEEVNATGLINSDDENEELEIKKKKGRKKIVFSDDEANSDEDDEEEDDCEEDNEEGIDLHDEDDEEQLLEKEIEAQESGKYKPTDFLENEAELSESDWDSADEDEKGLDELEFEQGDEETFNENKVRSELERIHMRQVLDEDNREVKLLQELLLEDGEMHGTGRQRQFRWKTLDSAESSEFEKRDDDDIFLDEEENEEQWRKMRHKREMFLKKKTTDSDDVASILSDSQILNINKKIIVKSSQSVVSQSSATGTDVVEVAEKKPFSLLSKRGSFLSRSDQVLQRLAEYNKVTETVVGNTAKNSRCFLFQTVESNETVSITNNNNKRKAAESTPQAIKKLRLSDLSPAVNKKQKNGRFKNLFGNW